jgi:ferredoxin-type protein NapG
MSDKDKVSRRDLLFFWRRKPEEEEETQEPPPPRPAPVATTDAVDVDDDEDPIFDKAPTPMTSGKKGPRARPGDDWLRPPGARPEAEFLQACTKCGKCTDACGANAIFPLSEEFGALAGTPAIAARKFPCWLTPDVPCIAACPTGALLPTPRFEVRIGLAALDEARCLVYQGTPCDRCVSVCPAPGALVVVDGRPKVVADDCTGCGVCEHVCPTDPASIHVRPARLGS